METYHDEDKFYVTIDNRHAYVWIKFRKEYEPDTNAGRMYIEDYSVEFCDEDFPHQLLTDEILIDAHLNN